MPANTEPIFALTPHCSSCAVAAANTASDGSGTLVDLFSAGSNGSRIDRIRCTNAQATAAASSPMVIRFFITDTGGSNPRLFYELALGAATRSTTVIGAGTTIAFPNGVIIASGQILKVIQSVYAGAQDLMHYFAEGGDF